MASNIILIGPTGGRQGGLDLYEFDVTRGNSATRNFIETTKTLKRKLRRNSLDTNWHIHKIQFLRFVDDQDPEIAALEIEVGKLGNRLSEFQTMLNFIVGGDD